MTDYIESDRRGTASVKFDEDTSYVVIHLPDGTTVDISVDPVNGNNHIKLYDDEDYAVLPMDSRSKIRPLDVWNSPVESSSARGTVPGNVETVDRVDQETFEDVEFEDVEE